MSLDRAAEAVAAGGVVAFTGAGISAESGIPTGVITQNTDGLHAAAGSRHVIELHGSFLRRACLRAGHLEEVTREEFAAGLDRAVAGLRSAFVPSFASLLPRCPACGGPSRSDVVTFGEAIRGFPEAEAMVGAARALLVVGTHGEVEPAASLPKLARSAGAVVIEVGPAPTEVRPHVAVRGRAGRVLPALVGAVRGWLEPPATGVLQSGVRPRRRGGRGGH
jgi:NAD-dependent deacetylase